MTTLHALRRRPFEHPAITSVAALDCVLIAAEMAANRPADTLSWLLFAVQSALAVWIAFAPTAACAVSLAVCVLVPMLPGSPSVCTLLAFPTLGLLAYLAPPAWSCLAAVILSLAPNDTGVSMSFGGAGGDTRVTGFTGWGSTRIVRRSNGSAACCAPGVRTANGSCTPRCRWPQPADGGPASARCAWCSAVSRTASHTSSTRLVFDAREPPTRVDVQSGDVGGGEGERHQQRGRRTEFRQQ